MNDAFSQAPINIWPFHDAPEFLQKLSGNGGDEDWIAVLAPNTEIPMFLEEGGPFGCCTVERHQWFLGITVLIGCHA